MIAKRTARAVPQPLKLVEHHHEMLGHPAQREQLGVQRLGILVSRRLGAPHRALDHADVEPDLLLERLDLVLAGTPEAFHGVAGHRVVHTADEPGNAHHPLKVHLHHIERRRVVTVRPPELERQLVRERRLARVTGTKERDVRLTFQRQRDMVGERVHADDLGRIVERAVPDERVEREPLHRLDCTAVRYGAVPCMRYTN